MSSLRRPLPSGIGRRWLLGSVLAVALSGALCTPTLAQRSGDRARTPEERAELEQRFRARMDRMVRERLGLSAAEGEALGAVTARFDQRRRALGREEAATRKDVEALMSSDRVQDDEARTLLNRLVELRSEESALFAEEQAALLEVLTPAQVLQLHDFRRQLGQRIRALRNRGDGQSRTRPPGGDADAAHAGADRRPWQGGHRPHRAMEMPADERNGTLTGRTGSI